MSIHFTVRSIPELASLPDTKREQVWQRCHPKAWRHWQTWLALLVSLACLAGGFYLCIFAQEPKGLSWQRTILGPLLLIVGSGGFFPIQIAMTRRYIAEELRRESRLSPNTALEPAA